MQTQLDRLEYRIEQNVGRGRKEFRGLEADASALFAAQAGIANQLRNVGAILSDQSTTAAERKATEALRDTLVNQLMDVQSLIRRHPTKS